MKHGERRRLETSAWDCLSTGGRVRRRSGVRRMALDRALVGRHPPRVGRRRPWPARHQRPEPRVHAADRPLARPDRGRRRYGWLGWRRRYGWRGCGRRRRWQWWDHVRVELEQRVQQLEQHVGRHRWQRRRRWRSEREQRLGRWLRHARWLCLSRGGRRRLRPWARRRNRPRARRECVSAAVTRSAQSGLSCTRFHGASRGCNAPDRAAPPLHPVYRGPRRWSPSPNPSRSGSPAGHAA
jgi:hypothetical protein